MWNELKFLLCTENEANNELSNQRILFIGEIHKDIMPRVSNKLEERSTVMSLENTFVIVEQCTIWLRFDFKGIVDACFNKDIIVHELSKLNKMYRQMVLVATSQKVLWNTQNFIRSQFCWLEFVRPFHWHSISI